MVLKTKIIQTDNLDPWRNLAIEEYLLDHVEENQCILYLWQNQNTVVIGKNQNPWKECRRELLEREGGKLARRISGGGAVFHDTGNLNFSFIADRKIFDIKKQLDVILYAVKSFGIPAEFSGRNDLTVGGRKFSGNAYCYRKTAALHHGTLLISADFAKLTRYLQVSEEKIRSKGIESVRSRVINLTEYRPDLDIEKMCNAIIESFENIYQITREKSYGEDGLDSTVIDELYGKYSSWEWRYGESPRFDIDLDTRFPWGGLQLGFQMENGIIKKAYVYSDAMDEAFIEMLPAAFEGVSFRFEDMADSLSRLEVTQEQRNMLNDILQWLKNKEF